MLSLNRKLRNKFKYSSLALGAALCTSSPLLHASEVTIPDSALISSNSLYSSSIGDVVVTTDGGNAANVGALNGRNDDGFRGPVDLGFSVNFFGNTYTQVYINNNGNVSFGNGISAYVPDGPAGATSPVISPFFADVDTRGANSGVVHLSQSANQDIITWDHVGYFDSHDDKLDTFQLVLRSSDYNTSAGEGQIGFFYTGMGWESTDTSTVAAIGFGDGAGNGQVLEGSIQAGTAALTQDHHIWFDLNGNGVPVQPPTTPPVTSDTPEPASIAMLLGGLATVALVRRKKVRS